MRYLHLFHIALFISILTFINFKSFAENSLPSWEVELNNAKSLFNLGEFEESYNITAKVLKGGEDGTQQFIDSSYFAALSALHAGYEEEAMKWFKLHLNAYGITLDEGNVDSSYFVWIDNLIYSFAAYHQNTGNYEKALHFHSARIKFFETYPSIIKPINWAMAHNNISVSLSSLNRFDEASNQLSKAIEFAKDDSKTLTFLKFNKLLSLASEGKCEVLEGEILNNFAKSLSKLRRISLDFELQICKQKFDKALSIAKEAIGDFSLAEINKNSELLAFKQYVDKNSSQIIK